MATTEEKGAERSSPRDTHWWNDAQAAAWSRGDESPTSLSHTAGRAPGLPGMRPNPKLSENDRAAELAARFGHGASFAYEEHREWCSALEEKLAQDWDAMKPGRAWATAKRSVRSGWNRGRKILWPGMD